MNIEMYNEYNSVANSDSIIQGKGYRITLLTPRLIRLEYSNSNKFEDSKTKMVLNRNFPLVNFEIYESENSIKVITKYITLRYDKKEFSPYGLSVELNGKPNHPYKEIWHYGDEIENLGGTIRTLDFIDGEVKLENGVLSKYGISILDDSNSPILSKDGWYEERNSNDIDIYIFAYRRDYKNAIKDYYSLTGKQPKLPRYALGNWWSRYYPYSSDMYTELLDRFELEKIPFSIAVLDMDWHIVDIEEKYGSMWTAYTWNNKLFPNPENFIQNIKKRGYNVTLNIHPSAGVRPFEKMYKEFSNEVGLEYNKNLFIDFNHKSRKYFDAMFKVLYAPNEKIGVDFWWIDWQQSPSKIDENKDPLWVLNHYHYNDNQKNNKIGLTFSRYSGPGSHRYPIGFSGDVVISWESLDFQPYFTATASNIGYGWWSHDIGGHRHGYKSEELMLRWLQFGVFSPINRLHSSNSEFIEKEPWNFKEPYRNLMGEYLRLRHKLLPYIYTMNVLSNEEDIPFIKPMYYEHPEEKESYEIKNQYYFGSKLLVCPITKKIDEETQMASFNAWLPKGSWYDFQTGLKYLGDRNITISRSIENMAIFFKEGSIIPLAKLNERVNDISNPKYLELLVASGENGSFTLIEDNLEYLKNIESCRTTIEYFNEENKIIINSAKGNTSIIPLKRNWEIKIYGKNLKRVIVKNSINIRELETSYDENSNITTFKLEDADINDNIEILMYESNFKFDSEKNKINIIKQFLKQARINNQDKGLLFKICSSNKELKLKISEILMFNVKKEVKDIIFEILLS